MRHRVAGKRLGRNGSARRALGRSLVVGLLTSPALRIVTTVSKAKWVRGFADSVCSSLARAVTEDVSLNVHRSLARRLGGRCRHGMVVRAVRGVSFKIGGGNIRISKLPSRRLGDAGRLALVEVVR